jgi:hypothetical protein
MGLIPDEGVFRRWIVLEDTIPDGKEKPADLGNSGETP